MNVVQNDGDQTVPNSYGMITSEVESSNKQKSGGEKGELWLYIPWINPPGWQVRQKLVMRWLALTSAIGAPQRGQGSPVRRCTCRKVRG